MSLLRRSVTSSVYNITANAISLLLGFVSSIILARLLEPEVFGTFAFVASTVQITTALPYFGFQAAFMNRTGGKAGVTEEILRVHFTLQLLSSAVWAALMAVGAAILAPPDIRWVFWVVIATAFFTQQTSTIDVLLRRRVQFRRLAVAQAIVAVVTPLVSIGLAWRGWGLEALAAANIVAALVEVVLLYAIRPVWRPRLGWSKELVRYFIGFGSKVFWGTLLAQALDRVDDVWTGAALGERALGFYSKAYQFATYPRKVISAPLTQVVGGAYAALLDDRPRLSRAFSWVNILLVRANFWIAGVWWLIAPEFIRLAIGVKWMPMLDAFRVMLIYTLFDPIKLMIGGVISLSGAPERVIRARVIQLGVMIGGMALLGPWLGITGVALAVDVMLVLGILILYAEARRFVDFSLKRIFSVPALALGLSVVTVYGALALPGVGGSDWRTGMVKIIVFSLVYVCTVGLLEREQIPELWKVFRQIGIGKKQISVAKEGWYGQN